MRVLRTMVRKSRGPERGQRSGTGRARGRWRRALGVRQLGAGALAALALAILAVLAVRGIPDAQNEGPAGTDPAGQSASASPAAEPTRPPLPPVVIEVARAFQARDADGLLRLLGGIPIACRPAGGLIGIGFDIDPPPLCPPGVSLGTPVGRYIVISEVCHSPRVVEPGPFVVERLLAVHHSGLKLELHAAVWSQVGLLWPKPVYHLVYRDASEPYLPVHLRRGRVIAVSDNGIVGISGSLCSENIGELMNYLTGEAAGREDYFVYPPSEVLP